MTRPLPATEAVRLLAGLDDAFLAYGADADGDPDVSFDDATDQAGYDYGFAGVLPSIAAMPPGADLDGGEPVTLPRALLVASRALRSGTVSAGSCAALPVCAANLMRRRKIRLVLTDPALDLPAETGPIVDVTPELETLLRAAAAEAGNAVEDGETLEAVTVTAARHRYKPVVTSHAGGSASSYVVLHPATGQLLGDGARTAGEARRAAVELLKAGPVGGVQTARLEVVRLTRRADGQPYVDVARTRIASRVVLSMTVASVKNPAKLKTTGWLFYGRVPADAVDGTADTVTVG